MKRFAVLDDFRAIAVMSMIVAHFAPGFFDRLPSLNSIRDQIVVTGRLATVAFVMAFGLTLGYVYLDKIKKGYAPAVSKKLISRSAIVFACSIVFSSPFYINNILNQETELGVYLRDSYNVLCYYALALLVMPSLLQIIAKSIWTNAIILGVSFWLAGHALTLVWNVPQPNSPAHFLYDLLAGGAFAFFKVTGFAIIFAPLGYHLKNQISQRSASIEKFSLLLLLAACTSIALGIEIGNTSGELTTTAFVLGAIKTPPRIWYWLFVGGICLLVLLALILAQRNINNYEQKFSFFSILGRASLPIFTLHMWILPVINWTDNLYPTGGIYRIFFGMVLFCLTIAFSIRLKSKNGLLASWNRDVKEPTESTDHALKLVMAVLPASDEATRPGTSQAPRPDQGSMSKSLLSPQHIAAIEEISTTHTS
jgi:hypothetical protein